VCPLCGLDFGDQRATGTDVTPYAHAYALGESRWWAMCEWVWYAPSQRLQHLALMRASSASRRFARLNLALLTALLSLFVATQVGWKWVANSPAADPTGHVEPLGDGWLHVASAPRPLPTELPPEVHVDLWWNVPQAIVGLANALVAGAVIGWLTLVCLRRGVTRAHLPSYRPELRMTAALHYNTAWVVPICIGLLVLLLRPVVYIGAMADWAWYPAELGVRWAGGVVTAFGVGMWWFWLIRLGATATPRTRARVIAFFAAGAPLIVGVLTGGWYFGVLELTKVISKSLNLEF